MDRAPSPSRRGPGRPGREIEVRPAVGQVFVGRQPIFDGHRKTRAFEVLFRDSAEAETAVLPESRVEASARVMVNTFGALGVEAVLSGRLGFFNVTREALLSEAIEVLPTESVVLEVLETVEVDDAVTARCQELRSLGFRLALDDYVWRDPREPLIDLVDYVKVDLQLVGPDLLRQLVSRLRRHRVEILAEKVETEREFELCRRLGFDLYQGYFLSRPTTLSGNRIDSSVATLIGLMGAIGDDQTTEELTRTFKQHAELSVNLLRLVNSAAFARPHPIETLQQALVFLGTRHLRRWITLLLFAGADERGYGGPLLQTAALRGRLMECLVRQRGQDGQHRSSTPLEDSAFLAGMLSLVGELLGISAERALEELSVDPAIRGAVLDHEGELGRPLALVEALEKLDALTAGKLMEELQIDHDTLQRAQAESYRWVRGLESEGPAVR